MLFKIGNRAMQEFLVSALAQTDALTKLLIEKGLITEAEFMQKLSTEQQPSASVCQSPSA